MLDEKRSGNNPMALGCVGARSTFRARAFAVAGSAALAIVAANSPLNAQGSGGQFGGQARADAASKMIVLAVQQGISSLPPTAAQSVAFEYDPTVHAYKRSDAMGPLMLRSPETLGKGVWSIRASTSYFELSDSFGPTFYAVEPTELQPGKGPAETAIVKFGMDFDAKVTLVNLSVTHGVTDWFEASLNLPIVITKARAFQAYTTTPGQLTSPPDQRIVAGSDSQEAVDALLGAGILTSSRDSFGSLGFDFNDGTHAGVGRITLQGKASLYSGSWAQIAFAPELALPSPSSDEFAGSDSVALLPRVIGQATPHKLLRLYLDLGYDYDFDFAELRRFVWNVGASVPVNRFAFDLGVGGSEYDKALRWSPTVATGRSTDLFNSTLITAQGDTQVGTSLISLLLGAKVRITDALILGGGASIALNNDMVRPDALGTLAIEYYL